MSLKRRDLTPERMIPTEQQGARWMSPPLVRFCSAVAFCVTSILLFRAGTRWLGINYLDVLAGTESRDWRLTGIFVGALVGGLVSGLIGLAIGASFKVKNDRTNFILTVLWHYLANGTVGWIALTGFCIMQAYEKNVEAFWANVNESYFMFLTLAVGTIGSLAIGAALLIARQIKEQARMFISPSLAISVPLGLIMGYLQWIPLNSDFSYWWIAGILFSVLLVPVCGSMIQKDLEERRKSSS